MNPTQAPIHVIQPPVHVVQAQVHSIQTLLHGIQPGLQPLFDAVDPGFQGRSAPSIPASTAPNRAPRCQTPLNHRESSVTSDTRPPAAAIHRSEFLIIVLRSPLPNAFMAVH